MDFNYSRSSSSEEKSEPFRTCEICLGEIDDSAVNPCNDKTHAGSHRNCLEEYLTSKVSSFANGTCSVIQCPFLHSDQKMKFLEYNSWSQFVPEKISLRYFQLANSLLVILCGGCHCLRTIAVESSEKITFDSACYLRTYFPNQDLFSELETKISAFVCGSLSTEIFYQTLIADFFPKLQAIQDREAWSIFKNVLGLIGDPERKNSLHLRYLRDRPRIWTSCCDREHCFRCKTRDFHIGRSCSDNLRSLDSSIVLCPSCGIALTKGDGCNAVTCVCGRQFSWSAEKEITEKAIVFLQAHPNDTAEACANILCGLSQGDSLGARAWRTRNLLEANQSLLSHWRRRFPFCPSQAITHVQTDREPEGMRFAAEIWTSLHSSEVSKCKEQNLLSLRSVFLTLYPFPCERYSAARRILSDARYRGPSFDPVLLSSVRLWVNENKDFFNSEMRRWELSSSSQFLFLFGNHQASSAKPSFGHFSQVCEWSPQTSNTSLLFSNRNTSVLRPGSVSCYPAAFADLLSPRSAFTVILDQAPRGPNWLTFGLATQGMPVSSSDGVGRSYGTWGISDDRGQSNASPSIIAGNGVVLSQFRKLKQGDVLKAVVDTHEGWVDISVNETDLIHRFFIPCGDPKDFVFAMTFANDHSASIVSNCFPNIGHGQTLSLDQMDLYFCFRQVLRNLCSSSTCGQFPDQLILRESEKWTERHTEEGSLAILQAMHSTIEESLSMKLDLPSLPLPSSTDPVSLDRDTSCRLTWSELFQCLCWLSIHRRRIEALEASDMAQTFLCENCESAPFIAAALCLSENNPSLLSKLGFGAQTNPLARMDQIRRAKAYMMCFPEDMHDWYDYNASLREPLLQVQAAQGCRCLPRHQGHCPSPSHH